MDCNSGKYQTGNPGLNFSNPKIRVWKKNPGLQSLINNKQQVVIMVIITARGLMGETKAKC